MNVSQSKGASGKFLALLASLSMIMVGLVGVMFASPASADADKIWICHADTNNGNGGQDLGHGSGGEHKNGFNLIETATAAWDAGHQGRHPNDRPATSDEVAQGYCGPPDPVVTTEYAYWCADGSEQSASRTVTDGTPGSWTPTDPAQGYSDTSGLDCSTEPVVTTEYAYWCADGSEQSASRTVTDGTPGDWTPMVPAEGYSDTSGLTCGTTVEVCTENCGGTPPPPTDYCPNLEGIQWEGYDCTPPAEVVETEVVEAAQVTVPQPATVAPAKKPTKKPAKVVLPATIPAGVANVSAPESATVPSSVPAGGGSQAPGVPMWALAMIVVGALGAAGAGMKVLGARE